MYIYLEEAFTVQRRRVEDGHVSVAELIVVQQEMATAAVLRMLLLLLFTFDPLVATDCKDTEEKNVFIYLFKLNGVKFIQNHKEKEIKLDRSIVHVYNVVRPWNHNLPGRDLEEGGIMTGIVPATLLVR